MKELLAEIGLPARQQSDLCALTMLAMSAIKKKSSWNSASNEWINIHNVIQFISNNYGITYAENSRETFRKQALHHFRTAAIIEDNGTATNSPNYCYRLTAEFLNLICSINSSDFKNKIQKFKENHESLAEIYRSKKKLTKLPVKINNKDFTFSTGAHNRLQKAIIEEFAPRFAPNSECLYIGDTIKKDLVKETDLLSKLGFDITLHDKMPDVILYREDKDGLYFIEAVDSVGPMSSERIRDIKEMTKNVKLGMIFITAFLDFSKYKKISNQLAWDTEVWIAEMPDHMIHLNGDKFLGPR
ncbi:MAG TPA: BsuBI/PstI family type II restriction endonuclease [Paludibacteraceae bacterium]|nr:BsuBI/PstI family type II restriction endonuclease [Paludibacteraceae bacterium]